MNIFSRLFSLLFVPKCVGCGERISDGVLCIRCRSMLKEAMNEPCSVCMKPHCKCVCAVSTLKIAGARRHVKLFSYLPSRVTSVENKIIYTIKKHHYTALFQYLTDALSASVKPHLVKGGWAVTYMPRSTASVSKYGFDQSKILAQGLAKKLDIPFVSAFSRKGNQKQKALNRAERKENAEAAYALKRKFSSDHTRFLLVDDICTSGSTLARGVSLLKGNGAKTVLPVTLGATVYQEK